MGERSTRRSPAWRFSDSADMSGMDGARRRHGFRPALHGTLQLGRTNLFFLGGGKALMNSYYASAERLGIDVLYEADVVDLHLDRRPVRVGRGTGGWADENDPRRCRRHRVRGDSRPTWTGCARSGARSQTTSSCAARLTTQAFR